MDTSVYVPSCKSDINQIHRHIATTYDDFVDIFNIAKESMKSGERLQISFDGEEWCDEDEPNWNLIEEAQMMARFLDDDNLFATLRENKSTKILYFDIYKL